MKPPPGASSWKVLRRPVDAFSGPDDPAATVVAARTSDLVLTDFLGVLNGVTYFYRAYYRQASGAWLPGAADACSGVAASTYRGDDLDPQLLVRERLEMGLAEECRRKRIKGPPKHPGKLEVTLAPFALSDDVAFPCVSVHLATDASAERGMGETLAPDTRRAGGGWTETEGWLSRVVLNIVGVSANPDERVALRRAIKRIVQANFPVWELVGFDLVDFSQADHEDAEHYVVPLYFTLGTFSCLAPAFVEVDLGEIKDVSVTMVEADGEQD